MKCKQCRGEGVAVYGEEHSDCCFCSGRGRITLVDAFRLEVESLAMWIQGSWIDRLHWQYVRLPSKARAACAARSLVELEEQLARRQERARKFAELGDKGHDVSRYLMLEWRLIAQSELAIQMKKAAQ